MKSLIHFVILCFFCISTSAQTKTWVGANGSSFNVAANWNPVGIPTAVNDVIIPTSSNVIISSNISIKSITLSGNAIVAMNSNIILSGVSSISQNATFNFNSGTLSGTGTLTNNGIINENGISIMNSTNIINNGTYNVNTDGAHYSGSGNPILNNTTTGVINLNLNSGSFSPYSGQGTVINSGVINKTGTGAFGFNIILQNNNGTFNVQNGTLSISNSANQINGGIFNIAEGKIMNLDSNFKCTQTLSGQVLGHLNWNGNLIVEAGTQAILNFTTGNKIDWNSGQFNGNGTLKNTGTVNMRTTTTKTMYGSSIFNNEGIFNYSDSGVFYLANTSKFNNLASGNFNIKSNGSLQAYSGAGTFTNTGTIRKTLPGDFSIQIVAENNDGTILAEGGSLTYTGGSNKLNDGVYNVSLGASLNWEGTHTCTGTLSGQINGALNWIGNLNVAPLTEASLDFDTNGISWNSGTFQGNGSLNNIDIVNIETTTAKTIYGSSQFKNESVFNINSTSVLYLANTSQFKNLASATLNIKSSGSIQAYSGAGTLTNTGTIKKTQSGLFIISIVFVNNDGTVLVQGGSLTFNNGSNTLNNGTYTVNADAILNWDGTHTLTGTLTGVINGDLNWNGTLNVEPSTNASLNFSAHGLSWNSGTFQGNGSLTNLAIVNLKTTTAKTIYGSSSFINQAAFNITSPGVLYLANTTTFTNKLSAICNISSPGSIQAYSGAGTFTNIGLIKKTEPGTFTISIVSENNNGTILVQQGTLLYNGNSNKLNGGTYTVNSDAILNLDGSHTCTGTLSGVIDGALNWNSTLIVAASTNAKLNFSNQGISWNSGIFQGNGTLTNIGMINLETPTEKTIYGSSIFKNESDFNINATGVLYLANSSSLHNVATGVINIKSNGSIQAYSGAGTVLNTGIIKKISNSGVFSIANPTANTMPGIIEAEAGTLNFSSAYTGNGIVTGNGTINLNSSTFNGTMKPGGLPGKLEYLSNYTTSAATIMEVDLNGTTPTTAYDVLAVQNNAVVKGTIVVNLGFAASLNDEFKIITATNITCDLPATVTASYDSYDYVFDVICNPTNVTLKVSNKTLGLKDSKTLNISVYPNPSNGQFTIDLGKSYSDVTVHIYNALGQYISSESFSDVLKIEQQINTAAGIYFVKVKSDADESKMFRIVKR